MGCKAGREVFDFDINGGISVDVDETDFHENAVFNELNRAVAGSAVFSGSGKVAVDGFVVVAVVFGVVHEGAVG